MERDKSKEYFVVLQSTTSNQCRCMKTPLVPPWSTNPSLIISGPFASETEAINDMKARQVAAEGDPTKPCFEIDERCV
jgi:hypothetical protein